jgi:DNA-binding MarR family transcriptional regulator
MKNIIILTIFTFLLILISGCLKTLHPIFTEKDLAYNPGLLGNWKTESEGKTGRAIITNLAMEKSIDLPGNISSISQKGYLISYQDENGNTNSRYIVFLARIGKHLYFDYYPAENKGEEETDEFFKAHFIKMHTSYRVNISKDGSFELSQLDESYVTRLIDEKKIRISHEKDADDNTVITASTEELQQYLIKYGDEPSAYRSEKTIFKK